MDETRLELEEVFANRNLLEGCYILPRSGFLVGHVFIRKGVYKGGVLKIELSKAGNKWKIHVQNRILHPHVSESGEYIHDDELSLVDTVLSFINSFYDDSLFKEFINVNFDQIVEESRSIWECKNPEGYKEMALNKMVKYVNKRKEESLTAYIRSMSGSE
jgi:hypothetical protein